MQSEEQRKGDAPQFDDVLVYSS